MYNFVSETTTTTTTTTEGKTKDTKIHSTITIAVIITIGLIILAGSAVTFFIRTSTFKNMMKPQNSNKLVNGSNHYQENPKPYQDINGLQWHRNSFQGFTDQIYSRGTGNAYIFYNGQARLSDIS